MAEAVAAIGLAASIVQLVDYAQKLLARLNDFKSSVDDIPKSFRAVRTQLPVLIGALDKIRKQADHGLTIDDDLQALLEACLGEVKALKNTFDDIMPAAKASGWQRRFLALRSLGHDASVKKRLAILDSHIQKLILHQTTIGIEISHSLLVDRVASTLEDESSRSTLPPIFHVPFARNPRFSGRAQILEELDRQLHAQSRRAVLVGGPNTG
jgi:hypothetical protein